jgi:hypothetical protein
VDATDFRSSRKSKASWLRGLALVHPGGVVFAVREFMEYWNGGKMEYWGSKADHGLILFSGPCHPYKKQTAVHQTQHSILPVFHHSTVDVHCKANFL